MKHTGTRYVHTSHALCPLSGTARLTVCRLSPGAAAVPLNCSASGFFFLPRWVFQSLDLNQSHTTMRKDVPIDKLHANPFRRAAEKQLDGEQFGLFEKRRDQLEAA